MTLTRFVTKSAFRNKRRSILTVVSITFSLLLLTLMMTVWRAFYMDTFSAQSAQRLITRHRVSLTESMPLFYREKIRTIPGVVAVAPSNWFGGIYKDEKPENFFAQFGTDPEELFKIFTDFKIPSDQLQAWQRDRAGVIVDDQLAKKYGWKMGDRIVLKGTIYPVDLELTIRGIYTGPAPTNSVYFNQKYVEEAVAFAKGKAGTFDILADTPDNVPRVAAAVDDMFRNSPEPTKTESEKAFQLDFINSIGNVKAFILSICFAVVFATLPGFGYDDGHVDPRAHPRSGGFEDPRVYPADDFAALHRGSGGGGFDRWRAGLPAGTPPGLGHVARTRDESVSLRHEGNSFHSAARHLGGGDGRISERDYSCLPLGKIRYRGGSALHRVVPLGFEWRSALALRLAALS